jgi:hypothetical protein
MHGWIGRKDRLPVSVDAVLHRADGSTCPVKLSDMSEEGCRIEGDVHLEIAERLIIEIPQLGRLRAQIRWALMDSAGAKFLSEDEAS